MADLRARLGMPKIREDQHATAKFTFELDAWTKCYEKKWQTACQETAEMLKNVEAFLVLPSGRTEMRQTLINAFSTRHPNSANLSELLSKPPDVKFGAIKNEKHIKEQLIVNYEMVPRLATITKLLLVDDWFGTGATLFAVQALVAALSGKEIVTECAVPGISVDEQSLKKREANEARAEALLLAMRRDAEAPTNPD